MSNKLQKYQKIYYYIRGDEQKLRNRFAFFCEWARLNNMNYMRDRRKHTITFKCPVDKVYIIFKFLKSNETAPVPEDQMRAIDICATPSIFVEAAVAEMQEVLGIDKEEEQNGEI